MSRTGLRRLRPAILKLAALSLLGGAAAMLGIRQAQIERAIQERLFAEGRILGARLASADRDAADLAERAERYRELEARGLLASERRLDWVDLIASIREVRRLFDVDYDFAAQRPLDTASPSPDVAVVASTMRLRMSLLHEGDLVGFLDDLARRAPALLRVRECRLERMSAVPRGNEPAARLAASCRIDWIGLRTQA